MNTLQKAGKGAYHVIDASGQTIARIEKRTKGGYIKLIYNVPQGKWINPNLFGYFPTLAAAKRYYNIK